MLTVNLVTVNTRVLILNYFLWLLKFDYSDWSTLGRVIFVAKSYNEG